jgi:chemotaxis protein MotB
MIHSAWKPMVLLVVLAAVVTGCCDAEKAEISSLTHQNEVQMQQINDFKDEINVLHKDNEQLKKDAEDKAIALVKKDEKIASLEAGLAGKDTTGVTEGGWEKGLAGDKITVGTDLLFASGRATLRASGKRALENIVRALNGTYAGLPVRVYGYTDSDPIRKSKRLWKDNLDLSANRAMAVTRYLISRGIDKDNIETVAMGATRFSSSNKTRAGKANNRRVEIVVIKKGL